MASDRVEFHPDCIFMWSGRESYRGGQGVKDGQIRGLCFSDYDHVKADEALAFVLDIKLNVHILFSVSSSVDDSQGLIERFVCLFLPRR